MANNHMGCVEHGKKIIQKFSVLLDEFPEFSFAFKLQYRNLDTFIRPDFIGRTDVTCEGSNKRDYLGENNENLFIA